MRTGSINEDKTATDVDQILQVLARHATAMYIQISHPPSSVRVAAGEVVVELCWSGDGDQRDPNLHTVAAGPAPWSATPVASGSPTSFTIEPPDTHLVCSSTVGTFYRGPEPGARPFVQEGDVVSVGQQVGIVEAMKLMIPVESDRGGRVVEVLVVDSTPVEHGQPLLAVTPGEFSQPEVSS